MPGLPDEHCPGSLDPREVYAVLGISELQNSSMITLVSVDEPGVLCAAEFHFPDYEYVPQFGVRPSDGALVVLGVFRDGDIELSQRGFDWLGRPDDTGWPRGLQTPDPFENDEILKLWEDCGYPRFRFAPDSAVPTYSCTAVDEWSYDLDGNELFMSPGRFLATAADGSVWFDASEEFEIPELQFRRVLPGGEVQELAGPSDAQGVRLGWVIAARAFGDDGIQVAAFPRDQVDTPERWSVGPGGAAVAGVYSVTDTMPSDMVERHEPVLLDADGTLVHLGGEEGDVQTVVRTPADGEPEVVFRRVALADAQRGDVVEIYGLLTGP